MRRRPAAATVASVEVDEITTASDNKRLFSGWMFASSPGLSAIEHPVYDIWLTGCKGATEKDLVKTKPEEEEVIAAPANENQLAKPLGPDGKPLLEPAERAALDRAAAERRRQQQINRSTTAGPILPGQPLNTGPAQAQQPTRRFFPLPGSGGGVGGVNPGILVDPRNN